MFSPTILSAFDENGTLECHFAVRTLHIIILSILHIKHSHCAVYVQSILTIGTLENHRKRKIFFEKFSSLSSKFCPLFIFLVWGNYFIADTSIAFLDLSTVHHAICTQSFKISG